MKNFQISIKFQSPSNRARGEALLPLREVGIFSGINITPESTLTNAKPRILNAINIFTQTARTHPSFQNSVSPTITLRATALQTQISK
jgi:hypothetical protein